MSAKCQKRTWNSAAPKLVPCRNQLRHRETFQSDIPSLTSYADIATSPCDFRFNPIADILGSDQHVCLCQIADKFWMLFGDQRATCFRMEVVKKFVATGSQRPQPNDAFTISRHNFFHAQADALEFHRR